MGLFGNLSEKQNKKVLFIYFMHNSKYIILDIINSNSEVSYMFPLKTSIIFKTNVGSWWNNCGIEHL